MCMLEQRGFKFYFLTMQDYQTHSVLGKVIEKHQLHMIKLDGHNSMYDYSATNKLLDDDNFHPSLQAHEKISKIVYEKLKEIL